MESEILRAASAIASADFLLIGAGAGMSADSGLPVYANLSENPVYKQLGVTFNQIVTPQMLVRNPALFYGHELSVQSLLTGATPHEGYEIISRWRTALLRKNEVTEPFLSRQFQNDSSVAPIDNVFVVTSNLDGHFIKSGFHPNEVAQIHGSGNYWQCGGVPGRGFPLFEKPPCCSNIFPAPSPSEYSIDTATMQAVFPGGAKYLKCKFCSEGIARPNTLLFGDGNEFIHHPDIVRRKEEKNWTECVRATLKENPKLKLVILEIGCGIRIPSIRKRCEEMFQSCPEAQTEFIRINPDYPLNPILKAPSIPIQGTCKKTLQEIEEHIER
eukprot:TRINITY_DN25_c0_g2_i1.p1 TRINITY_DN25_c0_g2~~TRINITY_DN25_c0_g2_i1.p1  ORF type:complete len:328 (-),score=41.89 TRINITY_DN25_c0_g2_i1:1046-2029(-)